MWVFIMLAIISGLMLPTQSAVNGLLKEAVGNPFLSGAVSNLIGASIMIIIAINTVKINPFTLPTLNRQNWFMLLGGVFSAVIVVSSLLGTQKVGFVTYMSFFLISQLIGSVFIDYFGLFHSEQKEISFETIVGVVFQVIGILFIVRGRR